MKPPCRSLVNYPRGTIWTQIMRGFPVGSRDLWRLLSPCPLVCGGASFGRTRRESRCLNDRARVCSWWLRFRYCSPHRSLCTRNATFWRHVFPSARVAFSIQIIPCVMHNPYGRPENVLEQLASCSHDKGAIACCELSAVCAFYFISCGPLSPTKVGVVIGFQTCGSSAGFHANQGRHRINARHSPNEVEGRDRRAEGVTILPCFFAVSCVDRVWLWSGSKK